MNKRLLAVAVGTVVSAGALATPVINDSVANVYATESLNATTPTVDGADVNISTIGTGVTANNQLFVRMDLSGGVKTTTAPVLTPGQAVWSSITVAQGGVNSAFTIFSLTANANTNITDSAIIDPGVLSVPGTSVNSTVTVCTYDSLSLAVNQTGALGCDTHGTYLSFVTGVAAAVSTNELVASVDEDYELFVGPTNNGWLGTHTIGAAANVLDAQTGAAVAFTNIVDAANSVVTYAGDFSVGNFFIAPTNACAASTVDLVEKVNNVVQPSISANLGTGAPNVNGGTLCVSEPGTTAIPVANYTVAVDLKGVTGKIAPADISATGFGSIVRDGTQIEVDYMTTFTGYNQRILMTNRGNRDYTYETTFATEDGVTATPGPAATGTLPAGEVTVVRVTDMVTFTGATRGSAVITIPATAGTVDAAATQVNLSDGGTDTVYLD